MNSSIPLPEVSKDLCTQGVEVNTVCSVDAGQALRKFAASLIPVGVPIAIGGDDTHGASGVKMRVWLCRGGSTSAADFLEILLPVRLLWPARGAAA